MSQPILQLPLENGLTLGMEVRSLIHGLQGKITEVAWDLSNSVVVTIQPPVKDNELPKPYTADYHTFITYEGADHFVPQAPGPDLGFRIGDHVRDKYSQHEGIITGVCVVLNGCIYVEVTPKTDWSDKSPRPVQFDQHRIELVGSELTEITQEPVTPETSFKGGARESTTTGLRA